MARHRGDTVERQRREDSHFALFLLVSIIVHALLVLLYPQWQASALPASLPLGEGALQLSFRQSPDAVLTPALRPVTPQRNEPRPVPRPEPRPEAPVQEVPAPPRPEVNPEPRPVEQPTPQVVQRPVDPTPQVQNEPRPVPERVPVERPEQRPEPTMMPEPRPEPRPEPTPVPQPQADPVVAPQPEPNPASLVTSDSGRAVVASAERPEAQVPGTSEALVPPPVVEAVEEPQLEPEPVRAEESVAEVVESVPEVPPAPPPPPPPPPEPPLASAMLRLPGALTMPKDIVLTRAVTIRLLLTVDGGGNITEVEFDPDTISENAQANRLAELHALHNFSAQPSPDGRPYQIYVSVTFDPDAPGDRGLRFATSPAERIRFLPLGGN